MTNLAVLYSEGIGVQKDNKEAVRLLRLASEQGHARAQTRLAHHLFYGRGCEVNYGEAVMWYQRAGENGSVPAMYHLGLCLENGYGVEKSIPKAIYWYEKAAAWGDQQAYDRLISLVANPALIEGVFANGHVAPAA